MRRFVELDLDHMIGVSWSDDVSATVEDPFGYVTLTQFEGSCKHGKYTSLRIRLRDAWRTFRGDGRCFEEMYRAEQIDALILALQEGRQHVWGPTEPTTSASSAAVAA